MTPEQELELSISIKRKRAAAAAAQSSAGRGGPAEPKFGMAEAGLLGAADSITFNTTDEIAGGYAYGNARPKDTMETLRNVNRAPQFQLKEERDPEKFKAKEAAAVARGDSARDTVRGWQEKARTDRPITYLGGALTGALLTGKAPVGLVKVGAGATRAAGTAARAIPGVSQVANVAGRVAAPVANVAAKAGNAVTRIPIAGPLLRAAARGAGPGAAWAALAGAGEAKDDRLMAGLNASGPGAMFGAGLGAGAKAVGVPIGAFWNALTRPSSEKSVATIARMMRNNKVAPVDAATRVREYGRGKQDVFETAAEFMGPSAQGMQTALGNVPGPSQKILQDAFTSSIRNMRKNLNSGAKKATGKDPERYHQTKRDQEEARLLRDKANYDAVQGHPLGGNRMSTRDFNDILFTADRNAPHMQPLGKRPAFIKYVEETRATARAHGDFMEKELNRFLQMVGEGKMPRRALSNRAINEIDKRISQDIEVAVAKGRNNDARILKDMQDKLRVTDLHTGLGSARDTSAIGLTAKDALVEGRKAFQHNIDLEDVTSKLGDFPQEVADAYLTGMVREMSDSLANQSNLGGLADAAQKIAATPAMRDKLTAALPKTRAGNLTANSQRFMALLDRVTRHTNRARLVYGNSATAPRMMAVEEAAAETSSIPTDAIDLLREVISRQPGKVMDRVATGVQNRLTRPGIYNPRLNEELGKRLGATSKKDILAVLDEVSKFNNRRPPRLSSDRVGDLAARVGGQQAGTGSAQNDPWAQDASMARADVVVEGLERPMIAEYLKPDTPPERLAQIEAVLGGDALALRQMRQRALN